MPATLDQNIEAYKLMRDELEANHMDQWVVFYDEELIGTFDEFQDAAVCAATRFGRGPYLIKLIGEPEWVMLPRIVHGVR